jgi:hypothetical protein
MMMLAVLVGAASCSSDSGGRDLALDTIVETSVSVPATTVVAPTLVATTVAPAPTEPETTVPPDTTLPPTDPPTTVAETTTTTLSKEDIVRADFEAAINTAERCSYDPANCDFAAIAIPGSPMDLQRREVVQQRLDLNLRAVEGKGAIQLRIESVGFEGASAFVTICSFDTVIIYDIVDPVNPDDDIVYDDDQVSSHVRWEMRQEGERWLLYEGINSEVLQGGDLCAF